MEYPYNFRRAHFLFKVNADERSEMGAFFIVEYSPLGMSLHTAQTSSNSNWRIFFVKASV